ncbi:S8 family serine peptidase [Geodermatophilus sp. SYSU D00697]
MKPHLRVVLRPGVRPAEVAYWRDVIDEPALAASSLVPQVDEAMRASGLPYWVTREYAPADDTGRWSPEEVAAGLDRVYRLILRRSGRIPQELVSAVRLVPAVADARVGEIGVVPLPRLRAQALSVVADASRERVGVPEAHAWSRGDSRVTVAVLDTGVDEGHPELAGALADGYDFVDVLEGAEQFLGDAVEADADVADDVGHGTHVAGIVAGRGEGMPVGVVPDCRLLPVRVLAALERDGRRVGAGLVDNINAGVKWAVDEGAEVINMSLGIRHEGGGLPHREVVDYALRKGATVVAAAGNDGRENLYYPGALPGVVAVGALDEDGEVAAYSTYGRQVALVAPGTNVLSCGVGGGYAAATGTSHAAPFVAGAAALLKSHAVRAGWRLPDRAVKHVLQHTADKPDQRFRHPRAGFGCLNLVDALRLLDDRLDRRVGRERDD